VYGHTGNFPGYVQWAAASSDGQHVVTTSLNIPAPGGALLRRLRSVQADAGQQTSVELTPQNSLRVRDDFPDSQ